MKTIVMPVVPQPVLFDSNKWVWGREEPITPPWIKDENGQRGNGIVMWVSDYEAREGYERVRQTNGNEGSFMTTAVATKERPILFSGPMVMAILGGRKTQTRRVMKRPPELTDEGGGWNWRPGGAWCWTTLDLRTEEDLRTELDFQAEFVARWCPYGRPGDRLWVRESLYETSGEWWYSADSLPVVVSDENYAAALSWAHHKGTSRCPSIHMPRFASRLTLEVTRVRVERIQEITNTDALAEGVDGEKIYKGHGDFEERDPRDNFRELWDRINGERAPWRSDPWVWVVEFRRV